MQPSIRVRACDPLSSVRAAERVPNFAAGHYSLILSALANGRQATPHEMQAATGLTVVQIDRRLPELLRHGKARVVQINGEDLMRGTSRVWEAL